MWIYVIVCMCVWVHVRTGQCCGWCVCVTDQISIVKFQLIFSSNCPHHSSLFSLSFCLSLFFCLSLPHLSLLFLPHYSLLVIIFFKLLPRYFNFPIFYSFCFSTMFSNLMPSFPKKQFFNVSLSKFFIRLISFHMITLSIFLFFSFHQLFLNVSSILYLVIFLFWSTICCFLMIKLNVVLRASDYHLTVLQKCARTM